MSEPTHDESKEKAASPQGSGDMVCAAYDDPEHARIAVKLLTNLGFSAAQVFVLCSDKKRSDAFRARLMPAGASQLNTAPTVVGAAGAALGATVLGGAGLATGGVAAVAGAAIGAVAGGGIGVLFGAGTYSDDETKRLMELYGQELEKGSIIVHVRADAGGPGKEAAENLLAQARQDIA